MILIAAIAAALADDPAPPSRPDPIPPAGQCVGEWCEVHRDEWVYLLDVESYAWQMRDAHRAEVMRRIAALDRLDHCQADLRVASGAWRRERRARATRTVLYALAGVGLAATAGGVGYAWGRLRP